MDPCLAITMAAWHGCVRGVTTPGVDADMRFLADLRAEHDLIDAMAGSLRGFSLGYAGTPAQVTLAGDYLRFFRLWAGQFHHHREEDVLFPALVGQLQVPADRGPVAVLTADHQEMGGLLTDLAAAVGLGKDGAGKARDAALSYTRRLQHHIDAENSVLLPECAHRLTRAGVPDLPSPQPTADQVRARDLAEGLLTRFPPCEDGAMVRGDGCIMCPAYGVSCDGLEKAWWSEAEWEDARDRLASS